LTVGKPVENIHFDTRAHGLLSRVVRPQQTFGERRQDGVEEAVRILETAILPELAAFGGLLSREIPGIATETFSLRHAPILHCLGLSCFPAGSGALDERCVALIVNVIDWGGLVVSGYVQWQAPALSLETEIAVCQNPSPEELAAFCPRVRELFAPLRAAVFRGRPPG
jgi:hypothetical protein